MTNLSKLDATTYISSDSTSNLKTTKLPALYINCPEQFLFGWGGVYDSHSYDIEKKVAFYISYPNESPDTTFTAGLSLHSRTGRPQRGLKLKAKNKFGHKKFRFDPFRTNSIHSYEQLILRAAGNDNTHHGGVHYRDILCTSLYSKISKEHTYSDYQTTLLFLNDQYYGIYHLREKQGKDFIKRHFKCKNVDLLERSSQFPGDTASIEGNWNRYNAFISEFKKRAKNPDEALKWAEQNIDLNNFTDYFIFQSYISNTDWLVNNIKFFRPHDNSDKWKFLLWDTDWGLGLWQGSYPHGSPNFNMFQWIQNQVDHSSEALMFSVLMKSEQYNDYFTERVQALANSHLSTNNVLYEKRMIEENIKGDIEEHLDRWNNNKETYINKVDSLEHFINERTKHFVRQTCSFIEIPEPISFKIDSTYLNDGIISIDDEECVVTPDVVYQFPNNDITFIALPKENQKFIGWYDSESILISKKREIKNPKTHTLQPRFSK